MDLPLRQDMTFDDRVGELQLNLHGFWAPSFEALGSVTASRQECPMPLSMNCACEHCLGHRRLSLHADLHVDNLVQELHLWSLHSVLPALRTWFHEELGVSHHSVTELNLSLNFEQLNCSLFELDCRNWLLHAHKNVNQLVDELYLWLPLGTWATSTVGMEGVEASLRCALRAAQRAWGSMGSFYEKVGTPKNVLPGSGRGCDDFGS